MDRNEKKQQQQKQQVQTSLRFIRNGLQLTDKLFIKLLRLNLKRQESSIFSRREGGMKMK